MFEILAGKFSYPVNRIILEDGYYPEQRNSPITSGWSAHFLWGNGQEWRGISKALTLPHMPEAVSRWKNPPFPFPQWAGLGSRNSGVRSQVEEATGLRVGEQNGIQIPDRGKAHVIKPRHSVRTEAEQQRCMESGLLPTLPQGEPCTL